VQARGALKRELLAHLRSPGGCDAQVPTRFVDEGATARAEIKEAVSIRENVRPRPKTGRCQDTLGGGSLLAGSRNTHVATLVGRSSRFVMLVRVVTARTPRAWF
jgi:hypothetical protein